LAINILYRYIMEFIEIKTLIDITKTRTLRANQSSQLEFDQFRNFMTLCQCLEIRSIISYEVNPSLEEVDIKGVGFGNVYKGKQRVWTFKFMPDRTGVYADDKGNPVGNLIEDIHQVPIIKNLSETVNIDKAIFNCTDNELRNIIVKLGD
jgi:hypothetical protein